MPSPTPDDPARPGYGLPAWAHLYPDRCPICGRIMIQVDDLEGLAIYACPSDCEWKREEPDRAR